MFQRPCTRQAGFIRKRSQHPGLPISCNQQSLDDQSDFSPFKTSSPEPIERIILTYRNQVRKDKDMPKGNQSHRTQNHKKQRHWDQHQIDQYHEYHQAQKASRQSRRKQKQHQNGDISFRYPQWQTEQTVPLIDNYTNYSMELQSNKNHQKKTKPRMEVKITENSAHQEENIMHIECKPKAVQLSLSEAFQINCQRMRNRLQSERQKYSSKSKARISEAAKNVEKESLPQKRVRCRPSDSGQGANKENRNSINIPPNPSNTSYPTKVQTPTPTPSVPNTARPADRQNSSVKFFVPASTSRSKPITPKQAYQHSLKKWKQLPEVVAKEKERQKQRALKERLSKMRAHSLEVRNKMRR